ncbi:MAG: hypothetical protein AABY27_04540, partial [Pseudomonadota bacterium]
GYISKSEDLPYHKDQTPQVIDTDSEEDEDFVIHGANPLAGEEIDPNTDHIDLLAVEGNINDISIIESVDDEDSDDEDSDDEDLSNILGDVSFDEDDQENTAEAFPINLADHWFFQTPGAPAEEIAHLQAMNQQNFDNNINDNHIPDHLAYGHNNIIEFSGDDNNDSDLSILSQ